MKRTRKWAFVEQEAKRLCALGLSPDDIAKRLEVDQSTVRRWFKAGKLKRAGGHREPVTLQVRTDQTPAQWAADVRKAYALDATDEQLVAMGEAALLLTRDPQTSAPLRLQAMAQFRATVKQLALVARAADVPLSDPASKPKTPHLRVVRRSSGDPRRALMASNE